MSPSRIHMRLFILPLMRQSRISPSVHWTRTWLPPDIFWTLPEELSLLREHELLEVGFV